MAANISSGTLELGKTLHATHIPATVSVCSNVPGHEQPVHLQTDGDPQKLVHRFVDSLLEQQNSRVEILNQKYKSTLTQLQKKIIELKEKLGVVMVVGLDNNGDGSEEDDNDNGDQEIMIAMKKTVMFIFIIQLIINVQTMKAKYTL